MNLPMPTTPTYEIYLPVSKQTIKYRPFLVKEEKVLLIASETDSIEQANLAIRNVVDACTFNSLDLDRTPLADIEFLFVNIRAKSVGETINGEITCSGCGEKIDYVMDVQNVKVRQTKEMDPVIKISDNEYLTMKYPSIDVAKNLDGKEGADVILNVLAGCVDSITIDDTVYDSSNISASDIVVWLSNLTEKQLEKISEFVDTIPVVVFEDKHICPKCNHENNIVMEGMGNFFA